MSKKTKIWLWVALALSLATTALNASYGRWLSVIIALGALVGLCVLLFKGKKWGFVAMCACYALSLANGIYQGIAGGSQLLITIIMSLIGSALIPGITVLFLRRDWKKLQ